VETGQRILPPVAGTVVPASASKYTGGGIRRTLPGEREAHLVAQLRTVAEAVIAPHGATVEVATIRQTAARNLDVVGRRFLGREDRLELDGRAVFITGAARGIGAELARQAHARGALVSLVGRTREPLERLAGGSRDERRCLRRMCGISARCMRRLLAR
jgi:short chain dehydrogenase